MKAMNATATITITAWNRRRNTKASIYIALWVRSSALTPTDRVLWVGSSALTPTVQNEEGDASRASAAPTQGFPSGLKNRGRCAGFQRAVRRLLAGQRAHRPMPRIPHEKSRPKAAFQVS